MFLITSYYPALSNGGSPSAISIANMPKLHISIAESFNVYSCIFNIYSSNKLVNFHCSLYNDRE